MRFDWTNGLWKKAFLILLVLETGMAAALGILKIVEWKSAVRYPGASLGGYIGSTNGEGRTVLDGEHTDLGLLVLLPVTNLTYGVYDIVTVYSARSTNDRGAGRTEVQFEGDARNFYYSRLVPGNRHGVQDKAYISEDFIGKPLHYRIVYYGTGDLTIHEIRIMKRYDAINILIALMGFAALVWGAVLLLLPDEPQKWNWKTLTSFALLLSVAMMFFSGLAVALAAFAAVVYFVRWLIERKELFRLDPRKWEEESMLFVLFLVCVIGSVFAKHDRWLALGSSILMLLYAVLYTAVKHHRALPAKEKLAQAIAFAVLTTSVFSLAHFYLWKHPFALGIGHLRTLIYGEVATNIASLFEKWPTRGADKLAIVLSFLMCFLIDGWKQIRRNDKIVYSAALVFGMWSLALSHSREAYIFIVIAMGVFLLLKMRKKAVFVLVPLLVVMALTMFLAANEKIRTTFTKPLSEINIQRRLFQDKVALEIFRDNNKITGIGVMNFTDEFKRYEDNRLYENTDFIHNIYLALLAETGILGLISYLIFFILLAIRLWKERQSFLPMYGFSLVIAVAVASLATSMYIYAAPVSVVMWIALGYARNATLQGEE